MTIWNMEITASESPQTVHIPLEGKYYAIKNTGDHDILVSSYVANPTEGADDVMKIPSGSAAVIPVKDGDLYVSAEEDVTYSVSIQDDKVLPWSGGTGSGGGSGGDNTHYKGTTTTLLENGSTTNPIVIDGESYTAVFGDVVVYGYTEFVFDGTAWSEFGRPFDTTPTQGSMNAVTSDGVYKVTPFARGKGARSAQSGGGSVAYGSDSLATGYSVLAQGACSHAEGVGTAASGYASHAEGDTTTASGHASHTEGYHTIASQRGSTAIGKYNVVDTDIAHLLIVGNGNENARSNILEVSETDMNVNGDIKINNVPIPTPYTAMPAITEDMLGKIAMYVGATGGGFVQGCFYVASTDGAAEPTYSWVRITGYRRVTLWENETETKRPATINLSASIYDFDAFSIEYEDIANGITYHFNTPVLLQLYPVGDAFLAMYVDSNNWAMYSIASATSLTLLNNAGSQHKLTKIIGIKYGSGGGTLGALAYKDTASGSYTPAGSVSVAQSQATYVYDGTTGLTTYTEAGAPSATFTGTTENITVG